MRTKNSKSAGKFVVSIKLPIARSVSALGEHHPCDPPTRVSVVCILLRVSFLIFVRLGYCFNMDREIVIP